jgi:cytochrome b561
MGDINFHCPFARENTQPAAGLTIIFLDMSKAYFRLFSRAFPVTLAELWRKDAVTMQWRNSPEGYGLLSILLHWLIAAAVFGMFGLGLWMVDLDYYSSWYQTAPDLHKSIGLCLFALMLLRLLWRVLSPPPAPLASHAPRIQLASKAAHWLLYAGLFALMLTGYLISTADGRAISVFGWFEVPASLTSIPDQEDVAGEVHTWLAWALVILAGLHALAALKHHFIDRDTTLTRMLGRTGH